MFIDIALTAPPTVMTGLGLFLIFRVLGELDLSVDASFTSGAAILAMTVLSGGNPWLGLAAAFLFGSLISFVVFSIHRLGRTQYLLASLIVLTGMYSINLHLIGGAAVGLIDKPSIFDILPWRGDVPRIILFAGFVVLAVGLLYLFLNTRFGLALRAAGSNATMARANHIDTRLSLFVGSLIAGGLFALGGAMQAEVQGFADITMGIGSIIVCVAALFLGELVFPPSGRIASGLAAVVVGAVLYTTILTVALRTGLPPIDLKIATAGILVLAVLISRVGGQKAVADVLRKLRSSAPGNVKVREEQTK